MVYILLADGFETIEALAPYDMLKRADVSVRTVCMNSHGTTAVSSHGVAVQTDMRLEDLNTDDMEALVIPGGMPGTTNIDNHEKTDALIQSAVDKGCWIAAICAGPSVLGKRGVLQGKKAVCYPGFEQYLIGAEIQTDRIVRDGKIITAIGAGAAVEFGLTLVEVLVDAQTAARIRESIR